jgi:hypothetical protein
MKLAVHNSAQPSINVLQDKNRNVHIERPRPGSQQGRRTGQPPQQPAVAPLSAASHLPPHKSGTFDPLYVNHLLSISPKPGDELAHDLVDAFFFHNLVNDGTQIDAIHRKILILSGFLVNFLQTS